jgi:hypothetical protein
MRIRNQTDLAAGAMFIALAALALWLGRDLRVGTPMRMGPGYMPNAVAMVLAGFGALVVLGAFLRDGPRLERWGVRAIVLTLAAAAAFGLSIRVLGLVPTIVLVSVTASLASPESRALEAGLLAGGLAGFSVLVFVTLLGLPLGIWPAALVH